MTTATWPGGRIVVATAPLNCRCPMVAFCLSTPALIEMERIAASVAEARQRAETHRSAAAVARLIQVSNQPVALMLLLTLIWSITTALCCSCYCRQFPTLKHTSVLRVRVDTMNYHHMTMYLVNTTEKWKLNSATFIMTHKMQLSK